MFTLSSKKPCMANMFGCFIKLWSFIYSISWSSISASLSCFLLMILRARMKPVSFSSAKKTFPNLPLPSFLPRRKSVILNPYLFLISWLFCNKLLLKQHNFLTCKFLMLCVFMRDFDVLWESKFFVDLADPNNLIFGGALLFSYFLAFIKAGMFYLFSSLSSREGTVLLVRKGCLWKFLGKWAVSSLSLRESLIRYEDLCSMGASAAICIIFLRWKALEEGVAFWFFGVTVVNFIFNNLNCHK